jgi:hypothetical protein
MVTPPRFLVAATVLVSLLGFVLALWMPPEHEGPPGAPSQQAGPR